MIGAVIVGAALLVWAGAAKVAYPDDTTRALRSARLPASPALVRVIACVEVGVGAGAVVLGGRAFDAAMAASYAGLAVFVGLALARGWSLSSCGCFGESDARPTVAHVVVNATLAATAALAARRGARPLAEIGRRPGAGIALALVSVVIAGLVVLILTRLPRLQAEAASR